MIWSSHGKLTFSSSAITNFQLPLASKIDRGRSAALLRSVYLSCGCHFSARADVTSQLSRQLLQTAIQDAELPAADRGVGH